MQCLHVVLPCLVLQSGVTVAVVVFVEKARILVLHVLRRRSALRRFAEFGFVRLLLMICIPLMQHRALVESKSHQ